MNISINCTPEELRGVISDFQYLTDHMNKLNKDLICLVHELKTKADEVDKGKITREIKF